MKHFIFLFTFCLASLLAAAQDSDFPPRPSPPRLVNDMADMLSVSEEAALEQKLVNYYDTTSTQLAVVTLTSIGGYDINDYAARLGERWGIGEKEEDNGLLILVAKNERKVAISTGYGMEHIVPDAIAKRITERTLSPNFRQGQYYKGLDEATSLIISMASGEYQAPPEQQRRAQEDDGPPLFLIILIVMLVVFILARRGGGGGRGGGRRGARTLGGPIFIPGGFGTFRTGGGVFGGGGGGGFGGFGGGSFGGGGASSDW
ncbi:TPM domain-containing protein [Botryobacter ruber]|uniref:TPM domain-containing protein n=1 Tax=Botryobacter ruber TaxID=2171629 RepID=UPI0013E2AE2D|nr:TPM domain-containing protein [Botryobacter ruber]